MGCSQSKSATSGGTGRRDGDADGRPQVLGTGSAPKDATVIGPDPDLGWRTLPAAVALPAISQQKPTGSAPQSGSDLAWKTPASTETLYPVAWTVCLFNDRSGHFCSVSMITLALNIAVRAELLARRFGVSGPMPEIGTAEGGPIYGLPVEEDNEEFNRSSKKLYQVLRVPDYEWRLLSRTVQTPQSNQKRRKCPGDLPPEGSLQLLQKSEASPVQADVPSIGMNIAEQLFRLERKQEKKHELPTHTFGWKISPFTRRDISVAVTSPEGEALWIVPEELILNVTEWVQHTYFTSAALQA